MDFKIKIDRRAGKSITRLPKEVGDRIFKAIKELAENPHPAGSRKIHGARDIYRIRVAKDYRVVYIVKNQELIVIVIGAGHRKDIYRRF